MRRFHQGRPRIFGNWVKTNYKDLNVLINNAGIQRGIDLTKGVKDLFAGERRNTNELCRPNPPFRFFCPPADEEKGSRYYKCLIWACFVPIAFMPVYCATKAGLHLFTISLRQQLKATSIKVFEIIPPAVDTELGKGSAGDSEDYRGIPAAEVAKAVIESMKRTNMKSSRR